MIAAIVLHDIGKLRELEYHPVEAKYTKEGCLIGHVLMGRDLVREAARSIDGFPEETLLLLEHAILAHHGKREFGARSAQTLEAILVSFVDDLDAKMNIVARERMLHRLATTSPTGSSPSTTAGSTRGFRKTRARHEPDAIELRAGAGPATSMRSRPIVGLVTPGQTRRSPGLAVRAQRAVRMRSIADPPLGRGRLVLTDFVKGRLMHKSRRLWVLALVFGLGGCAGEDIRLARRRNCWSRRPAKPAVNRSITAGGQAGRRLGHCSAERTTPRPPRPREGRAARRPTRRAWKAPRPRPARTIARRKLTDEEVAEIKKLRRRPNRTSR